LNILLAMDSRRESMGPVATPSNCSTRSLMYLSMHLARKGKERERKRKKKKKKEEEEGR